MDFKDMINAYSGIKELSEFKNPLFIGPHPDDIEFGCGGLISKMRDKGAHISFLIVTDGAAGSKDPNANPKEIMETREKEARLSAKFLGVSEIEFLRYEDGGEYTREELINSLAEGSGTHFDPTLVEVFKSVADKFQEEKDTTLLDFI